MSKNAHHRRSTVHWLHRWLQYHLQWTSFWSMWALNYSSVAMETRKTSRDWMVRCQERSTTRKRESDNEEAVLHQLEVSCQEQEAPHYRKSHSTTLDDTLAKVWDEDCTSYDGIIICACDNKVLSSDCTLSMICTKGWRIDTTYDGKNIILPSLL